MSISNVEQGMMNVEGIGGQAFASPPYFLVVSFPWKRESSIFKYLCVPWKSAFAGMTTFYEAFKIRFKIMRN